MIQSAALWSAFGRNYCNKYVGSVRYCIRIIFPIKRPKFYSGEGRGGAEEAPFCSEVPWVPSLVLINSGVKVMSLCTHRHKNKTQLVACIFYIQHHIHFSCQPPHPGKNVNSFAHLCSLSKTQATAALSSRFYFNSCYDSYKSSWDRSWRFQILIHVFATMQWPICHTWRAANVLVTAALENMKVHKLSFLEVGATVY
jgi:hypothetical protein